MGMDFNGNSVFFGLFYSSFIMFIYMFYDYMMKRNTEINNFYISLNELVNNYYSMYKTTPDDYFDGIVLNKSHVMFHFWIKDFNEFIIDDDKLSLLVKVNKKYVEEKKREQKKEKKEPKEMEIIFTPAFDSTMKCPWCESLDFQWIEYEDDNGTYCCDSCGATCPVGTKEDCEQMLEE